MTDANPKDVAPPPYKETIFDDGQNLSETQVPLIVRCPLPEGSVSTFSTINRNRTNRPPVKRKGRQNPGHGQGRRMASMDEESYIRAEVKEMEKKMDGFTKVMCLGVTVAGIILCCSPLCCH